MQTSGTSQAKRKVQVPPHLAAPLKYTPRAEDVTVPLWYPHPLECKGFSVFWHKRSAPLTGRSQAEEARVRSHFVAPLKYTPRPVDEILPPPPPKCCAPCVAPQRSLTLISASQAKKKKAPSYVISPVMLTLRTEDVTLLPRVPTWRGVPFKLLQSSTPLMATSRAKKKQTAPLMLRNRPEEVAAPPRVATCRGGPCKILQGSAALMAASQAGQKNVPSHVIVPLMLSIRPEELTTPLWFRPVAECRGLTDKMHKRSALLKGPAQAEQVRVLSHFIA